MPINTFSSIFENSLNSLEQKQAFEGGKNTAAT